MSTKSQLDADSPATDTRIDAKPADTDGPNNIAETVRPALTGNATVHQGQCRFFDGESAVPTSGGGFTSATNSVFANVTAFSMKREIFDMDIRQSPASTSLI